MIRRRYEVQRNQARTLSFYPTRENIGRVAANSTPGICTYTVLDSALAVVDGPNNCTVVDEGGYSRLDCDIAAIATIGEGYICSIVWSIPDLTYQAGHNLYFDVVAQEWVSEVTLDTLKDVVPVIEKRLEKQGRYWSPTKDAEEMAAIRISDAQDKFDNVLRSIIRQTRVESRASLVVDFSRFDRIVAFLAVALVFSGDLRFDLAERFVLMGMRSFENMKLVGYDSDQDFVEDDEIIGPDRAEQLRSEFLGAY